MKKITEYIQNIENSFFEQELLSHIAIEYFFNCYLNEDIILEKYGTFDNCLKISKIIDNKIVKSIKSGKNVIEYKKSDLNNICKVFFNSLTIYLFKSNKEYLEYDLDKTTYNPTIDNLVINVYYKNINIHYIDLIVHELTHAYMDNELRKSNNLLYNKLSKSKEYKQIIKLSNTAEMILYMFHTLEVNSFIAQIKAELEIHKSKIKTPKDALNVLKKSEAYKGYISIENILNNNDYIDELTTDYNKINDTNYTSNKVIKILRTNSKKINKKLYKLLPKMCIEFFDNDELIVNERAYRGSFLLNRLNSFIKQTK